MTERATEVAQTFESNSSDDATTSTLLLADNQQQSTTDKRPKAEEPEQLVLNNPFDNNDDNEAEAAEPSRQVERPTLREALNYVEQNFKKIAGPNREIDISDDDRTLADATLATGKDGISAAAIFRNKTPIGILDHWRGATSEHGGLAPSSTISTKDISKLKDALPSFEDPKSRPLLDARNFLISNFTNLKADGFILDARITKPDFETAIKSGKYSGDDLVHLQTIVDNFDTIQNSCNDDYFSEAGVSYHDGWAWMGATGALDSIDRSLGSYTDRLNAGLRSDSGTDLYISRGDGSPSYLEAPLMQMPRAEVKSMIRQNSDGSVIVTFPGDKEHPVTVHSPTDGERAYQGSGLEQNILETALYKYGERKWGRPAAVGDVGATTKLLTGDSVASMNPKNMTESQLHTILSDSDNRLFTASRKGYDFQNQALQYKPETNEVVLFDADSRGIRETMSLSKFKESYTRITFASSDPSVNNVNTVHPWLEKRK